MISFIKRFFYFSFFLICLALILFHFFPQYISKDRPLNFLDDYVVENFNLKIKYDQIKLSLSRGIKLENFRLYDNPLTEPNLIFQSENIYLILRFNWKEFSIKPALYLNGINLKNLISTQNDKSPNRYSIPPNLRNFPISLKKILNSKRIQTA